MSDDVINENENDVTEVADEVVETFESAPEAPVEAAPVAPAPAEPAPSTGSQNPPQGGSGG